MYGCESWTLRKNEESRLEAFEMKGLRKIGGALSCQQMLAFLFLSGRQCTGALCV